MKSYARYHLRSISGIHAVVETDTLQLVELFLDRAAAVAFLRDLLNGGTK